MSDSSHHSLAISSRIGSSLKEPRPFSERIRRRSSSSALYWRISSLRWGICHLPFCTSCRQLGLVLLERTCLTGFNEPVIVLVLPEHQRRGKLHLFHPEARVRRLTWL